MAMAKGKIQLYKTYKGTTNITFVHCNVRSDGTITYTYSDRRRDFGEIPERRIQLLTEKMRTFFKGDLTQYDYMIDRNWEFFAHMLESENFEEKTDDGKATWLRDVFHKLDNTFESCFKDM